MSRNEVTIVRYVYYDGSFTIYVFVDDSWEKMHEMEIE